MVGRFSEGSTASTASRSSLRTFNISPTRSLASMAPRSISARFSILRRLAASCPGSFVGNDLRVRLQHRIHNAQVIGAERAAGFGDFHDGIGQA